METAGWLRVLRKGHLSTQVPRGLPPPAPAACLGFQATLLPFPTWSLRLEALPGILAHPPRASAELRRAVATLCAESGVFLLSGVLSGRDGELHTRQSGQASAARSGGAAVVQAQLRARPCLGYLKSFGVLCRVFRETWPPEGPVHVSRPRLSDAGADRPGTSQQKTQGGSWAARGPSKLPLAPSKVPQLEGQIGGLLVQLAGSHVGVSQPSGFPGAFGASDVAGEILAGPDIPWPRWAGSLVRGCGTPASGGREGCGCGRAGAGGGPAALGIWTALEVAAEMTASG